MALSTRQKSYAGTLDIWNIAEKKLTSALNKTRNTWTINPGDGASYGSKIDITIKDAIVKDHQCATIQLDFVLPKNFNLIYQKPDGTMDRPVIIHRAILGSVERMIVVLTENYGGKWPFWLSPRQICIISIDPKLNSYAHHVLYLLS